MSELLLADASEYQGAVDWNAYVAAGHSAAIVRAYNGSRNDYTYSTNRNAFHAAGGRVLGLYAYCMSGVDITTQATKFCDTVGQLRPGEFPILDLERGDGDQAGRARTWRIIVQDRLGVAPWLYSAMYYHRDHNLGAAGFDPSRTWIAAYQSNRPEWPAHAMWQFSETYGPMPGFARPHDCSRFFGTVDDMAAVTRPATGGAQPVPFPGRDKFGPGANNDFVTMLGRWLVAKGFGRYYTIGPGPKWGSADQKATQAFQKAQGWTGGDADGLPGPQTWALLQQ